MQVNSVNNQQQSFGMSFAKMSDSAADALKKRLKEKDVAKLNELIASQEGNKNVDIFLYTVGGHESTRLGANIYPKSISTTEFLKKQSSEGFLGGFRSPIHFIESLCQKANKMSAKIDAEEKLSNAIDSLSSSLRR